jgi:predicted MFS family arabinose efflux permease
MTQACTPLPSDSGATPVRGTGGGHAPYVLAMLTLTYTSAWVDRGVLAVLAQPIKADLGLADWQLGLLTGFAFSFLYSCLGVPMARLSERFSRVAIIAICLVVWSGMTALSAAAATFAMLLVLRCGVGVGEAGCGPASHSLITDYFAPAKRTMALSVYGLGVPLGMMIGAIAGGWIAQHYGWRTALVVVGMPGFAIAALVWATVREPVRGASEARPESGVSSPPPALIDVWKLLFGIPTFRHMAAGLVIFSIGMSGINAFIAPYYNRRFGLDFATIGLIVGLVASAAGMIGTLAGGYLAQTLGKRDARWYLLVPAIGIALTALFLVVALSRGTWQTMAAVMLLPQLLSAAYLAPVFAVTHNMVDTRMRATAAATLFFLMNMIGMSLGPLLVGAASDLLSGHFLAGGVPFATACPGGAAPAGSAAALAATCRDALSQGTYVALLACTPIILWGAAHYYFASRAVVRDLAGQSRSMH